MHTCFGTVIIDNILKMVNSLINKDIIKKQRFLLSNEKLILDEFGYYFAKPVDHVAQLAFRYYVLECVCMSASDDS